MTFTTGMLCGAVALLVSSLVLLFRARTEVAALGKRAHYLRAAMIVAEGEQNKAESRYQGEKRRAAELESETQRLHGLVNELESALDDSAVVDPFELVASMCRAFGQPVEDDVVWHPASDLKALRMVLLTEEFKEYIDAEQSGDMVAVADALGDMVVVIAGTAAAYGIPLGAVIDEIHRSNMTKVDPETGQVERREDGKVLKPASYEPPRLDRVLGVPDDMTVAEGPVVKTGLSMGDDGLVIDGEVAA